MSEVKILDHRGQRVILIDLSNAQDTRQIVATAEEAMRIVRSTNQKRSVRGLIDLSYVRLDKAVRSTLKRLSQNNGPYMKSVAFVGLGTGWSALVRGFLCVSGRSNHRAFKTMREAIDWLTSN